MKFIFSAILLCSMNAFAVCDYKMLIDSKSANHEANLRNVTLPLRDGQLVCIDVPVVKPANGLMEINSTNLGNASCSSVKMTVTAPDGTKLEKSGGPQPGTVGRYMPGRWKMRLKLKYGCNRYNFGARW